MDMADTIRRLRAYEAAGADVVYAPGLRTIPEVREVVRAVKRPLNVVTGWLDADITLAQRSEVGANRIIAWRAGAPRDGGLREGEPRHEGVTAPSPGCAT